MAAATFNRFLRGGALTRPVASEPDLRPHRVMRLDAAPDDDDLRGRVQRARKSGGAGAKLSNRLDSRLGAARRFGFRAREGLEQGAFDMRQRAVVKIHYFGHGGGGAAALKAHVRYVARDAAARDAGLDPAGLQQRERAAEAARAEAHAAYLSRDGARAVFYDAAASQVDGARRAAAWAQSDRRHFRIILAPEKGAELGDLKPFVRDVMARAERALNARLEWIAVDHWDTDNPHTHIILRGRRGDGRPLIVPADFVKHGFRNLARDAATDRLGERTRTDDRLALERECRAQRPTRLDALIARQLEPDGSVRLADLRAPDRDPVMDNALKRRARELQRLGLASETRRNVLRFRADWRDRLAAMEVHLDIRKQIVRARTLNLGPPGLTRGAGEA
ncbi:MAG: relaxase/mobilization nuclease domain-containing protein [Hyphomonadaceae bacterium]|nr:relaxase/mobilization nuclease domain-containing protein [Hyphomonadaceae bacterium]